MAQTKYQQTLNYLFCQLPMFQRVGKQAFKKDLTNILALCEHFDQPQTKFPSIHIAGTNGKGSTAHMLSAVLQAHGLKTGLYTSPHYRDFRERIKINSKYISKKKVIRFVESNQELFDSLRPSFFEISVAMAFQHFAQEEVDIAVIETGLGGRLDSTNILHPLLSIITNISLDHQSFLGDTLPLIAAEKAGIIKKNIPIVIGEKQVETQAVFEEVARKKNAPIYYADQLWHVKEKCSTDDHDCFDVYGKGKLKYTDLLLNLKGPFQKKNLIPVLEALELLKPLFEFKDAFIRKGLQSVIELTNYQGRWQKIGENPTILCDSAHNEAGLKMVLSEIQKLPFHELHCVIGLVKDKEAEKVLSIFPEDARYYFCKPDIPRGLDAKNLQEKAANVGLKGRVYLSVKNALRAANRAASKDDLIFVGGSTFVVAEVI
ncbi:MAG: bifunctional folylpolyglutamate synthase/dihydrofolate synthase [Bacteroidetes bacterium]|nr:bifunctional folylpolyglutamate synthase/dihydrofolate synthase [Bacteroidota bacterium]